LIAYVFLRLITASPTWKDLDLDPPCLTHRQLPLKGGMEGADRDRVVTEFRDGVTKILISTDVLSRGFDVSQVMVGRDGRRGAIADGTSGEAYG